MQQIEYDETRDMIREFSKAFGRPVNNTPKTPSVTDRILLGNLLLEEVMEYIEKGLGLNLKIDRAQTRFDDREGATGDILLRADKIQLWHCEGQRYDPIEAADGLGDVNVIVHFNSLWEGIDLTAVTNEIHRSNMSKLNRHGLPIINKCKNELCAGYLSVHCEDTTHLTDPTKPVGKILKGSGYSPPNLLPILGLAPHEEEE